MVTFRNPNFKTPTVSNILPCAAIFFENRFRSKKVQWTFLEPQNKSKIQIPKRQSTGDDLRSPFGWHYFNNRQNRAGLATY